MISSHDAESYKPQVVGVEVRGRWLAEGAAKQRAYDTSQGRFCDLVQRSHMLMPPGGPRSAGPSGG